jgi:hypothetical protein
MVDVLMEGKNTFSKSKRMFYFHPIMCFPIFVGGQKIVISPLLRWASVTIIYPPEHSTFRGVPRISLDGNPGFLQQMIRSRDYAQGILKEGNPQLRKYVRIRRNMRL